MPSFPSNYFSVKLMKITGMSYKCKCNAMIRMCGAVEVNLEVRIHYAVNLIFVFKVNWENIASSIDFMEATCTCFAFDFIQPLNGYEL